MRAAVDASMLATDLADYLVERGVPFREAHGAAGRAVKLSEDLGVILTDLALAEWQAIHPAFDSDVFQVFDLERALARRAAWGGTAPQAVREQLELAKKVVTINNTCTCAALGASAGVRNPKSKIKRGEQ
jgi:argininosuccinate lyase